MPSIPLVIPSIRSSLKIKNNKFLIFTFNIDDILLTEHWHLQSNYLQDGFFMMIWALCSTILLEKGADDDTLGLDTF